MNAKLTILFFLVLVSIASAGLTEKKVQGYLDKKLKDGMVKTALKSIVHKFTKSQYGCAADMDVTGNCQKHCQEAEQADGICHGMKCKCGVPRAYRK
uniref:Putative scorpine-like peptide n=2 Tax=Superstitionia donensis TaxID=311983 RepID=A0A1V1WBN5_9SCOR